jgi:hypothetical protein
MGKGRSASQDILEKLSEGKNPAAEIAPQLQPEETGPASKQESSQVTLHFNVFIVELKH